jgi:hypothetical protein
MNINVIQRLKAVHCIWLSMKKDDGLMLIIG